MDLRHIHDGQLRTALYHGSNRHLLTEHFEAHDVFLTTYETLLEDYKANGPLYKTQWHRVVLDEGMCFCSSFLRRRAEHTNSTSHS